MMPAWRNPVDSVRGFDRKNSSAEVPVTDTFSLKDARCIVAFLIEKFCGRSLQ
jgi:hypothetical protein